MTNLALEEEGELPAPDEDIELPVIPANKNKRTRNISFETTKKAKGTNSKPVSPPPADTGTRKSSRELLHNWRDGPRRMAHIFATAYKVSVKSALTGEHKKETKEAIRDEISNMLSYKVGHYIHWDDIPAHMRADILTAFMFIKHKTHPDGRYDRTKARIVGDGSHQKNHMYDLVYSATVGLSSVFILLNIATKYACPLACFDIKGAFLNARFGPKDTRTFIKIRKELVPLWLELDPSATPFVDHTGSIILELDKFIYGLKQAPAKFQAHLTAALLSIGYTQLSQDECLYIKKKKGHFSLLSVHVDDILQVTTNRYMYEELRDELTKIYGEVTAHPEAKTYLGMSLKRSKDGKYIRISQDGLVQKAISAYPPPNPDSLCNSPAHNTLTDDPQEGAENKPVSRKEYLGIVMTLMYVARLTRPDILLPVTYLAARSHMATTADMKHVQRIVNYLDKTKHIGITLHCESLQVNISCDASFAMHPDGKGHTGYILTLGESYLHARSGKQKFTATSSTEAEIIAAVDSCKIAIWQREIIRELDIEDLQPINLLQDNKSSLIMVSDPSTFKRSKHMLTKISYLRDLRKMGIITAEHCPTENMVSDLLQKLYKVDFHKTQRYTRNTLE
jgi:hypothetical protein